jgi:hypothetical protein
MDRTEANERVAEKFTRMMNATPSRYGPLSDVASASIVSAAVVLIGLFALRHSTDSGARDVVLGVAVLPLVASLLAASAFTGSREKVVSWLASLPIPVDNMNALLAGTSDTVELVFARGARLPTRAELTPTLESLSEDVLLLAERSEESVLEIKLGVIDSKRLPMVTNHRRYRRFVDLVERVVLPLRRDGAAIDRVRVV